MKTAQDKQLTQALLNYFSIPPEISQLVSQATADLYFGPYVPSDDYAGFASAVATIRSWADVNVPSDLWIDLDCDDVSTAEPQGYADDTGEWIEPYIGNTWHLDSQKIILRAIWDKELVACL